MPARPWSGAFGLRARIVGVVLVTTVATLAVAAVALLGPLEHRLRNAELDTVRSAAGSATAEFKSLDLTYVDDVSANEGKSYVYGRDERATLRKLQQTVGSRIGATVTLLGFPDPSSGSGQLVLPRTSIYYSDTTLDDPFDDVAAAFRRHRLIASFGSIAGTDYARVAKPLRIGGRRYVLAMRRPLNEVTDAVAAVRTAFLTAALAGLALTLLLGIPLSARLVRRLRRLRQAALRLSVEGPDVEVPVDRAHDEVGDLARTFATMQRRLQQQERARRAFVATASHELRTPLTSLDGMLELVEEDLRSGEPDLDDALSLLGRARDQSRRLGRLAADLLDLSRLDAEVQLRSEPVEFGELSRAVLAEFELGTAERGIATALDDSSGPVWALGDPGSVARILRILMDNAVRMTPEGGVIAVELQNGPRPSISVRDTGPGVAPEERELIFERFKRGRDTAGRAGFGLGLAIGRELAQRMGGALVLEDRPGPGATFTLRLPAAGAPAEQPVAIL